MKSPAPASLPPLRGLVLAGGQSRRMGRDKTALSYRADGAPQWQVAARALAAVTKEVFLSVRPGQVLEGWPPAGEAYPCLPDRGDSAGPLSGLLTAMRSAPEAAWLVVASDLPLLAVPVLERLLAARGEGSVIAYRSAHDDLPEPLCALYEPAFLPVLEAHAAQDRRCPRKILILEASQVRLLELERPDALDNANTPEDFTRLRGKIASSA